MTTKILSLGFTLLLILTSRAKASCGSAFCTVDTHVISENSKAEARSTLDLRFEYIDQNQVRNEDKKVAIGEVASDHDEVRTLNKNLIVHYNKKINDSWEGSVLVPLTSRKHYHIHDDAGTKVAEHWNYNELGDVQLQGRYHFSQVEIISGLKLPTGRTDVQNEEGENAERSLQPGTGTIDWLIGVNYHQAIGESQSSWFVQALYNRPFKEFHHFEAGDRLSIDFGYQNKLNDTWNLLVQLNTQIKGRDRGAEGEPDDSGGRSVSISPGISYLMTPTQQIYAFYQRPLYAYVNGVQLFAEDTAILGINFSY